MATRSLEALGHTVLAGWISPSHAEYVDGKMAASGQVSLPAAVRATCIKIAIESSPVGILSSPPSSWLRLGSWEAFGGHSTWPDFPVVVERLGEYLSTVPGLPSETRIYYVCGSDHAARCGLYSGALSSRGRVQKGQLTPFFKANINTA